MAPRANWKGFLRLSLVTCPVALYPATSESEKISFNQLNRQTGHRIKYLKVDADTGDEVPNEDIVKGYQLEKDQFIEVTKEELEELALESTRTIEIDEFVDKADIDPRYLIRPYYLRPDGKVGHDAFAVIRETIRDMDKVAIGRVVLTNREHIIALEPLDKGLVGTLLRYPYEVRSEQEYFDEIQDVKVTKDMLDLAKHIVNQTAGRFEPEKFEDHYETALIELINQKRAGKSITPKERPAARNVVDLMEALRRSVGQEATPAKAGKPAKKPRKASSGQKEMLMPIEGKKPKDTAAKKLAARPQRKSACRRPSSSRAARTDWAARQRRRFSANAIKWCCTPDRPIARRASANSRRGPKEWWSAIAAALSKPRASRIRSKPSAAWMRSSITLASTRSNILGRHLRGTLASSRSTRWRRTC
ncbi:DNA end-binding protein Ku [Bradyrhizobium diazoefficiens]